MGNATQNIFLLIGVLGLLWDISRTLRRIETKMDANEEVASDVRALTKTVSKHFSS